MGWPNKSIVLALLLTIYSHYCLARHVCEDAEDGLEYWEPIIPEDCNADVCEAFGDPYVNSFDCVRYEYHGECDYTLVKNCGGGIDDFEIIGKFFRLPLRTKSVIIKLLIKVDGTVVELDQVFGVTINGQAMSAISVTIPFTIQRYCNAVVVNLKNGITIYWSSPFRVLIVISPEWRETLTGNLCGLCGNFNSLRFDDFTTREDAVVYDVVEFGDSWRTEAECQLCNDCDGDVCNINHRNRAPAQEICQRITDIITLRCGSEIADAFFEKCVNILCASLPEYNGVCQLVISTLSSCGVDDIPIDLNFLDDFCEFEAQTECYTDDPRGTDYRGVVAVTNNGYTCQQWTAQSPNQHTRTPDNYPNKGLGDHNFCRNPDNTGGGVWCYTTDPNKRWEYCDVGAAQPFCGAPTECYTDYPRGTDYRGVVAVTKNSYMCQQWTAQSPNQHTRTPDNYPNKGLGDHNFCRNPDNSDGVWCYTTDPNKRWEYCDVGAAQPFCGAFSTTKPLTTPPNECYTDDPRGTDYHGVVAVTKNGYTCQQWTAQSPNQHTRTPDNYPNKGLGDHNFCRNPDNSDGVWCYTTDPNKRWEYCDVGAAQLLCGAPTECYTDDPRGTDYRGVVAVTKNGYKCQQWTAQSPNQHTRTPDNYPNKGLGDHNFCRNPDNSDGVWCYTTDPNKRWEYCDVGAAQPLCDEL